jgi:hypothetical protein
MILVYKVIVFVLATIGVISPVFCRLNPRDLESKPFI